jgi:hypothetical protein
MNRAERRRAAAMMRRTPIPRETLVHEAGHAVGRVLVAAADEWRAEEAIERIEIYRRPRAVGMSVDGRADLGTQACTSGKMFSKRMQAFVLAKFPTMEGVPEGAGFDVVSAEMRAAGIDVDRWCLDKSAYLVMGPAAEARYLKKPLELEDYAFESDLKQAIECNLMAGITDATLTAAIERACRRAEELLDTPGAWSAVLALADALKDGSMDGKRAAEIICRELGGRMAVPRRYPGKFKGPCSPSKTLD